MLSPDIIFTNILSMINSGIVSHTFYLFLLHSLQITIFPAPPPRPFFSFSLFGLMGRCSVIEVEPQNSRTPLAFPSTFCKTLYLKYWEPHTSCDFSTDGTLVYFVVHESICNMVWVSLSLLFPRSPWLLPFIMLVLQMLFRSIYFSVFRHNNFLLFLYYGSTKINLEILEILPIHWCVTPKIPFSIWATACSLAEKWDYGCTFICWENIFMAHVSFPLIIQIRDYFSK